MKKFLDYVREAQEVPLGDTSGQPTPPPVNTGINAREAGNFKRGLRTMMGSKGVADTDEEIELRKVIARYVYPALNNLKIKLGKDTDGEDILNAAHIPLVMDVVTMYLAGNKSRSAHFSFSKVGNAVSGAVNQGLAQP